MPRVESLQNVQSESKSHGWETMVEQGLPRMPSDVFAKKDTPTCRLSYLSDERYCIDDTQTAGGEADEVQLSSLRVKTASHTSPHGLNTSDMAEGHANGTS